MSSTRHLQTQTGRQIALGKELGKGGEGIVYQVQGEPALAAKIYHPNKASERRQKIEAIVDAHWHKAASNIAFPIDTLMGPGTQFVGFTMPLVAANKPIHNLYSPTSRKTSFPKANFLFLTRTALNIAQSFVDVHKTGCIIGDVNHSGVLIADDAIATLIDCDSFQVNVAGQTFLCKVGTPDFTPPELQGKRFDQCVRTANHDAFGLAVVLFNLLFMGRHPFAGRYLGRGDMPLETAIAQYRFAYSARHNETRTEPPPNVPLLADIPRELSDAFEIAFGPVGTSKGRPIAAQWVSILQRAESEIVQCKNSSGHQHFRAAIYCPWCRMETAYPGFLAFAPPIISVTTNPTNLANLIAAVRGISDPGNAPELSSLMPAFNGKASQATQSGKWKWLRSYAAAVACVLASLVMFRLKEPGPLLGFLSLAGGAFLAFRPSNADQPTRQLISQSASAWQNVEMQWNQVRDNRGFSEESRNAEDLVRQIQGLGSDEAARIANLKAQQREAELNRFLQNFYIDRAKIKGIGASRKVMLRSYGLETAADISQSRIQQISGFGPVIAGGLVAWRTSFERRFVHNPNQPLNPIDVAAVKAAIAKRLS